jgi:2-iminobutanoate/2-iminopropanoate deaminase
VKQAVSTTESPAPAGSYSQGISVGPLVFVAGQGPVDASTARTASDVAGQTHQAIRNVRAILAEAGCTLEDVVKVTAHLANVDDFADFDRVYGEYFRDPYPVRTTVSSRLIDGLVEIDAIAYRSDGADR